MFGRKFYFKVNIGGQNTETERQMVFDIVNQNKIFSFKIKHYLKQKVSYQVMSKG